MCSDSDVPPMINALILKGFARTPIKRQWNMRIMKSSILRDKNGNPDQDVNDFYKWLWRVSESASGLRMRSVWSHMDDLWVVVEPPAITRTFTNTITSTWGGWFMLTVREL
jgi:hypothetical protein